MPKCRGLCNHVTRLVYAPCVLGRRQNTPGISRACTLSRYSR
jgi:hypothetical protein